MGESSPVAGKYYDREAGLLPTAASSGLAGASLSMAVRFDDRRLDVPMVQRHASYNV